VHDGGIALADQAQFLIAEMDAVGEQRAGADQAGLVVDAGVVRGIGEEPADQFALGLRLGQVRLDDRLLTGGGAVADRPADLGEQFGGTGNREPGVGRDEAAILPGSDIDRREQGRGDRAALGPLAVFSGQVIRRVAVHGGSTEVEAQGGAPGPEHRRVAGALGVGGEVARHAAGALADQSTGGGACGADRPAPPPPRFGRENDGVQPFEQVEAVDADGLNLGDMEMGIGEGRAEDPVASAEGGWPKIGWEFAVGEFEDPAGLGLAGTLYADPAQFGRPGGVCEQHALDDHGGLGFREGD